ncbi:hypothetical protein V2A85_21685, partial [Yersinia sp. 1252 StPb PI]|uniref:hypothetical protein n=1 Tax=Yersinia sp. 1252 StPb PI TaxID=3117404 RepID=UPI003B27DEF1
MPYSNESKEKKTTSKETERDHVDEVSQWLSQGDAGPSSPDEGGDISVRQKAGSDNDSLFSFIRKAHLQEAQEFRR